MQENYSSLVHVVEALRRDIEGGDFAEYLDHAQLKTPPLDALVEMARDNRYWPIDSGWAPGRESIVAQQLVALFGRDYGWLRCPLPVDLFLVSELLDVQPIHNGEAIELWQTRQMRFAGGSNYSFAALVRNVVMETHEAHYSLGWHFHPLDTKGNRLGYRMFFSPESTQDDLWWEAHGSAPRIGSPSQASLRNAEAYYYACLKAVKQNGQFHKKINYKSWSKKFVKAGKNTYLAYCKNRGVLAQENLTRATCLALHTGSQ